VIPGAGAIHELDGLFVEPTHLCHGVGRALVEDAAERAVAAGAVYMDVTAGPASGFYERLGFSVVEITETRFGPALRLRREL
jgi:GNAT superfamily N-acetyltransferase